MEDSLVHIRLATEGDCPQIDALHRASVLVLNKGHYTSAQRTALLRHVADSYPHNVADRSYFVAEVDGRIIGTGGWSCRPFELARGVPGAAAAWTGTATTTLTQGAARISAVFVHPGWTRRGVASRLVAHAERAAAQAGYTAFELIATLTGVPLYCRLGYGVVRRIELFLSEGEILPAVHMAKQASSAVAAPTAA